MEKYDVIVAGGGFAGIGAAIAAARDGGRVLLTERSGALGGAASNCLVMPFMPYSTRVKNGDGETEKLYLVRGIFETVNDRLRDAGQGDGYTFNGEYLKVVLDRLAAEYGVDVLFHSAVTRAESDGRRIKSVGVATVAGELLASADCFVDATGDANLSALSGCEFRLGRESDSLCQPMTLCFRVSGVPWREMEAERKEIQELYKQYREEGKIKNPRENVLLFKTLDENVIHFNSTRVVRLNPTDPFELSRAEAMAREQMLELVSFLKSSFKSFRNAVIVSGAAEIGVRESRMVIGEHTLTGAEIVATTKFPDAIAAGNYDIDIHNPEGTGTSHYYFPQGEYYTIPYRSLVASDFDNLLVAGRCVSCDHEAQASIRIMPICCATGEAAGTAAAQIARRSCHAKDADVAAIQESLRRNRAFF